MVRLGKSTSKRTQLMRGGFGVEFDASSDRDVGVLVYKKPIISIVDDDESARESLVDLVKSMGFTAESFQSAEEFLQSGLLRDTSCLIADVQMPGITGLELHTSLVRSDSAIPTILDRKS